MLNPLSNPFGTWVILPLITVNCYRILYSKGGRCMSSRPDLTSTESCDLQMPASNLKRSWSCIISWDLCNPFTIKSFLNDDQEVKSPPGELVRQHSPTPWEDLQVHQEGLVTAAVLVRLQPGISAGNLAELRVSLWTLGRLVCTWLVPMWIDTQAWPPTALSGKEFCSTFGKNRLVLMPFQEFLSRLWLVFQLFQLQVCVWNQSIYILLQWCLTSSRT